MGYILRESNNMSTVTTIMIEENEFSVQAIDEVEKMLIDIEEKMSFYLTDSETSRINRYSGLRGIKVSPCTLDVIKESIKYSILSDGKFDITLGPVISGWGIFSNHERILNRDEIQHFMSLTGYKDIIINGNIVQLRKKGQKIDLGGIAKGYASDEAVKIFKKHNIKSAMINIGGNVSVTGRKENNDLWHIGIQNPEKDRGDHLGILECEDISVVTSGNYVRYFKENNKLYGHIINSQNGLPVQNDLTSLSIVCREGIKADALSTAVFSMGLERGIDFINNLNDVYAIFVTNERKVYTSRNLKESFYESDRINYEYAYF
ncbi:FAD:protein FMN transferase [uncultured Clostridium sp.]|uniref:FAD:protein FMN transferase n=1 Tax=uncultured Clostridium sp. TaxID=59620 RepID=UPI0025D51837|nr:FAD:protein FMN transferase [uncultured Clostridium sp.]